jgi:hypothetical protein
MIADSCLQDPLKEFVKVFEMIGTATGLESTLNNFSLGFTIPVNTDSEDFSTSDRLIYNDAG